MKVRSTNRVSQKKALFVWDGSANGFAIADELIANSGSTTVYAVHAMPHESIYQYGGVCRDGVPFNRLELELRQKFRDMTERLNSFRDVKLTLLFGDRVREIGRFANQFKIATVLVPRFEQSSFSRWIHGDLNAKLASKVFGSVTILDDKTADASQILTMLTNE